jgi:hypothetical protein
MSLCDCLMQVMASKEFVVCIVWVMFKDSKGVSFSMVFWLWQNWWKDWWWNPRKGHRRKERIKYWMLQEQCTIFVYLRVVNKRGWLDTLDIRLLFGLVRRMLTIKMKFRLYPFFSFTNFCYALNQKVKML